MAQGKAWDKEKVLDVLEPIFKLGCSINKACEYAGIPPTTVITWYEKDPELRLKINSWQNEPSLLARKNWKKSLVEGRPSKFGPDIYTPAKEWLERKEKDEFSQRQEMTGAEGKELSINLVTYGEKLKDVSDVPEEDD